MTNNFNNPLDELNRKLKSTFSAFEHISSLNEIQRKLMPFQELSDHMKLFSHPVVDLDFLKTVTLPVFKIPTALNLADGILKDINTATAPFMSITNSWMKEIPDYSKMLNEGMWHSLRHNESFVKDMSNIGSSFSALTDFPKQIKGLYRPLENVLSANGLTQLGKDIQFKFPEGLIDFSTHSILSSAFSNVSNTLGSIWSDNGFSIDDDIPIQDSLSIALNADLENATIRDSEIPAIVIEEELNRLLKIINNGKNTIDEIYTRLIAHNSSIKHTSTYKIIMFVFMTLVAHQIENGYDTLTGGNAPVTTTIISSNQITFTKEKLLKIRPDGRSQTVCKIVAGTVVSIDKNIGKWILISYIEEGRQVVGWTLNNDIRIKFGNE